MKKIFFLLVLISSFAFSQSSEALFTAGNDFYKKGEIEKAIEVYRKIESQAVISSELYYNLGNAYYRQGLVGQSIWAYNKALLLNPRLGDAKYNLEIVNASMKDRIVLPSELLPVQIYKSIKSNFTFKEWLLIGSLVVLFTVCFFVASKLK